MIDLIAAGWMALAASAAGAFAQDGTASAGLSAPDRGAFEAELKFSAGGGVFQAIEVNYPSEYRALAETLHRDVAAHPGDRAAQAASRKRLLAAFYRQRAKGVANAPAPLLNAINARLLSLVRQLARSDPRLCAEMSTTLFLGRFDLPASYQEQASAVGAAIVEAAKAGEGLPPDPKRQGLSEEDAATWYEQMLRDEPSSEMLVAIASDNKEPTGTPEMQCRVGAATFASIDKLDPERAANVSAFFLAQSLSGDASD